MAYITEGETHEEPWKFSLLPIDEEDFEAYVRFLPEDSFYPFVFKVKDLERELRINELENFYDEFE